MLDVVVFMFSNFWRACAAIIICCAPFWAVVEVARHSYNKQVLLNNRKVAEMQLGQKEE